MRFIPSLLAALFLLTASLSAQTVPLIRVGDTFEMRLSGMPAEFAAEFSIPYTVGQEGTVNVPLIGEMKVVGLTANQLERSIQNKLIADKIFTKPTVIINVSQMARFVSIGGGVRAPQRVQWSQDLTLNTAIENVGGLDDYGKEKGVRLIRDGKIVETFDLRVLRKDPSRDPKLLPGDQVYVPK